MTRALLAVFALATCGARPPDATIDGFSVYWHGHPERNHELRQALAVLRTHSPCHLDYWQGEIEFHPDPFNCGRGKPVSGCMPFEWLLAVGYRVPIWRSALIDEAGHAIWSACGKGTGENARGEYEPEFERWVSETRWGVKAATE